MSVLTPILKLVVPAFDQNPWDQDISNDLYVLDAAVGKFFGMANLAGVWMNATFYTVGQVVIDNTDGSMWSCVTANTSAAAPTTFSTDRANNPSFWIQAASTAQDYATQAQGFASSAATSATNAAASAAAVAGALPLSGGTMTGPITLAADPIASLQPATKQYVDARVGGVGFLPTTGGTMTGFLTLNANPTAALHAVPKQYADTKLALAGGTLTGFLTLVGNPTSNLHAATKQYADGKLALTGGALTGGLTSTATINTTNTIVGQGGLYLDAGSQCGIYSQTGFKVQQFAPNWAWQWNSSTGTLTWVGGGATFWSMRTSDNLCYNALAAVGGNGAYVNLSDETVKQNVTDLGEGMDALKAIMPISYTREGKGTTELGFSAQNVQTAIPQAISVFENNLLAISSEMILAVAVNAIKQLDTRVTHLENPSGT